MSLHMPADAARAIERGGFAVYLGDRWVATAREAQEVHRRATRRQDEQLAKQAAWAAERLAAGGQQ